MSKQRSAEPNPTGYPDFTLPVSIIAQIIEKLRVDIAAQTLAELKIDVVAQTLPELKIDIAAQTVSVKLVPDWGTIAAEDVEAQGCATAPSGVTVGLLSYTVPPGKTLLIYHWDAINMSSEYSAYYTLYNSTDGLVLAHASGRRGFQTPFGKPIRVAAGKTIVLQGTQDSGGPQILCGHFGGTLI